MTSTAKSITKLAGMTHLVLFLAINGMGFTLLSSAHNHFDHVQHLMDDWMQDTLEGNDDLRVACEGLRVKCQLIGDTLDELLSCDNGSKDNEAAGPDDVFCHLGMTCSILNDEL